MEDSPFHEVGDLFDYTKPLETVAGDTLVSDALQIMLRGRYSQLPVMENGAVRGLFSLWPLARRLEERPDAGTQGLCVREAMETDYAQATETDSLDSLLQMLDEREAVLAFSSDVLRTIVTPADALRHLFRVARAFVLLQEIETALRRLIEGCVDEEALARAAHAALKSRPGGDVPTSLERMNLEDPRTLVTNRANWPLFERAFGPERKSVLKQLDIGGLRNDIFHFRLDTKSLSVRDYERLVGCREWLSEKQQQCMRPDAGG